MAEIQDQDLLSTLNGGSSSAPAKNEIVDPELLQAIGGESQIAPIAIQPTPENDPTQLEAFMNNAARGLTVGGADPLMSGISSLLKGSSSAFADTLKILSGEMSLGDAFSNMPNNISSAIDSFEPTLKAGRARGLSERQKFPVTSGVGDIAGSLVSSLGAAARIPQLLKSAPVLTSGALGSLSGGARNALESERLKDIPGNAMVGGGIGLLSGLAGGFVGDRVITPALSSVTRTISNLGKSTTRQADDILAKSLQDTFDTPKDALRKLEELGTGGTIADLGLPTQKLTGALARKDAGFGRKASEFLKERAKGAAERLSKAASSALGTKGKKVAATLDGIRTEQKTRAGKLYDAAAQQPTSTDSVENFITGVSEVIGESRKIKVGGSPKVARELQKVIDSIAQKSDDGTISINNNTASLIEIRKNLGDAWFSMKKDFPQAAKKLKEQIIKFDELLPKEYRAANKIWSSSESVKESILTGTKLARMHPDDVAELLKDMSVADRDGLLIGFARNVDDIVSNVQEGSKVTTLFNKPRTKKVLELLIPDKNKRSQFLNRVERENAFTATRHIVEGGSQTSANAEANQALQKASIEGIDLTSPGIASKAIQWLTKFSTELPEGTVDRLSRQLLKTGVDEDFITKLMETNLKTNVSDFISTVIPGSIGITAGAEIGSGVK